MAMKKKPTKAAKKPARKRSTKKQSEPRIYVLPKTAAELGIVCKAERAGAPCNRPVIWFDYDLGERSYMRGFVCDDHRISDRVEKLAQPQTAKAAV